MFIKKNRELFCKNALSECHVMDECLDFRHEKMCGHANTLQRNSLGSWKFSLESATFFILMAANI